MKRMLTSKCTRVMAAEKSVDSNALGCLDISSSLSLLSACKTTGQNLLDFWENLCKFENFDDYTILQLEEEPSQLIAWSGEAMHDHKVPEDAPIYAKIYLRGLYMRRNICLGRFRHFRLFLTSSIASSITAMTSGTTYRDIRLKLTTEGPCNLKGLVYRQSFWNEDFLILLMRGDRSQLNVIFVYSLKVGQDPAFLYTIGIDNLRLFPMAFFLFDNLLVLMPNPIASLNYSSTSRTMICVHDLSNHMTLVGTFKFPENGSQQRHLLHSEAAQLHKVGDCAVALCRVSDSDGVKPKFKLFAFSLPDCKLLQEMVVPDFPRGPLDLYELDPGTQVKDDVMLFMFYHPEFSNDSGDVKYGRLLYVDCAKFIAGSGSIEARADPFFDCNSDRIEKMALLGKKKLVCSLRSGKIEIRDVIFTSESISSHVNNIVIPCPEPIRDVVKYDADKHMICVARDGIMFAVMRNFISGRKIHAYSKDGSNIYTLDLGSSVYGLGKHGASSSSFFLETSGKFLCAADFGSIIIWYAENGEYVRTIPIPEHGEVSKQVRLKGHADFEFREDGIIVIHSGKNFPVAADVILFW